jgi:hypothetical protein
MAVSESAPTQKAEAAAGIFVLSKQRTTAGISTLPKHNGMEIFMYISKRRKRRRTLTPDVLCDII